MMLWILTVLAAITAVFAIRAEMTHNRQQVYIFKPLTTILIIGVALMGTGEVTAVYKTLILIGLVFCLGGDIFLMLPAKYFIAGLVSFLIGHLFYIAAFVNDTGFQFSWWIIPLIVFGVIMYGVLHPHLGKMRLPVTFYILTILVMAWQALGRWTLQHLTGSLIAAIGALFFVVSDSVLALDRFRQSFPTARPIVLSTYWIAQWLIALSVGAFTLLP